MISEKVSYKVVCDRCRRETGEWPLRHQAIEAAKNAGWTFFPGDDTCQRCAKVRDRMAAMTTVIR